MKLTVKLLGLVLLLGFMGFFVIKRPDGQPWLSVSDLAPDLSELKDEMGDAMPREPAHVYRWQDDEGVWQFSDQPPEQMADLEMVELHPDRNLIQGLRTPEHESNAESIEAPDTSVNPLPLPTTVPMEDIPQLLEDAKQIQQLMQQRQQQLDSAL